MGLAATNGRVAEIDVLRDPTHLDGQSAYRLEMYGSRRELIHRWRVVLLTLAFAFLIVGFVSG